MPAKQKTAPFVSVSETQSLMVDVPHFFLTERSHWAEFKRHLNMCGLSWNLPGWMLTIVYQGEDYKNLKKKSKDIDNYFRLSTIEVGENKVEVGGSVSADLIAMLGFPKSMDQYVQTSTKYCNLNKLDFEPDSKLPARQKMWSWIVKCLQGPKSIPGPYFYLISQVSVYDISHLFKKLMEIIETVTICSLDDEVYNVTHLEFDPSSQNIFGYLEDLRKSIVRLNDLNERLPEEGRVIFSEAYVRSRLIRAARQVPVYKTVIDHLIVLPVEEWSKMSLTLLVKKFESAQANDISLVPKRNSILFYF